MRVVEGASLNRVADTSKLALQGVKVLIVDDSSDTLFLLSAILRYSGAVVTGVNSVDEAMGVLEKDKFDVIVSDICMPEQDGYDLIRKVRTFERDSPRPTPAVAVSAYSDDAGGERAVAGGFQGFLPKPVDRILLVELVKQLSKLDGAAVTQGFEWLPKSERT